MSKGPSALARFFAVAALVVGVVVLFTVISNSLGVEDDQSDRQGAVTKGSGSGSKPPRAVYVVQNGDTLIAIAHKTGVSIARIQALNPEVDPQILISGEKLKLR